jgi:hypothetical protein
MTNEGNPGLFGEVSKILKNGQKYPLKIPLATAYWSGITLVITTLTTPGERDSTMTSLITALQKVVPQKLIEEGPDDYKGDLASLVDFAISRNDLDIVGKSVLKSLTGRQIVDALPLDPNDRAELDGMRNRQLRAYLTLDQEFTKSGGQTDHDLKNQVEEQLS